MSLSHTGSRERLQRHELAFGLAVCGELEPYVSEVLPALLCDADVALIDLRGAFGEDVQEDEEAL